MLPESKARRLFGDWSACTVISFVGNALVYFLGHTRWVQNEILHIPLAICQSRNCFDYKTSLVYSDSHYQALYDPSLILYSKLKLYIANTNC